MNQAFGNFLDTCNASFYTTLNIHTHSGMLAVESSKTKTLRCFTLNLDSAEAGVGGNPSHPVPWTHHTQFDLITPSEKKIAIHRAMDFPRTLTLIFCHCYGGIPMLFLNSSWWLNHPSRKICASQIGSFPQCFGVKIKNLWNQHPITIQDMVASHSMIQ